MQQAAGGQTYIPAGPITAVPSKTGISTGIHGIPTGLGGNLRQRQPKVGHGCFRGLLSCVLDGGACCVLPCTMQTAAFPVLACVGSKHTYRWLLWLCTCSCWSVWLPDGGSDAIVTVPVPTLFHRKRPTHRSTDTTQPLAVLPKTMQLSSRTSLRHHHSLLHTRCSAS